MLTIKSGYEDLINAFLADAKQDAVAFQQIESLATNVMGVKSHDLDSWIANFLKHLLNNGVIPVAAKLTGEHETKLGLPVYVWTKHPDYFPSDIEKCVKSIIQDWKQMKDCFDFYVWFTLPENVSEN